MTPPPQASTGEMLAAIVRDHEKRIRRMERVLYALAGAASGGTGTWLTIIVTRR